MNMLVKHYKHTLIAMSVAAAMSAPAMATKFDTIKKVTPEVSGQLAFDTSVKSKTLRQEFPNYYIVELESAPLAATAGVVSTDGNGNRLDLQSTAAKKQADVLAQERQAFAQALKAAFPGAEVERHYDTVYNGVVVTSSDDIFAELKNLEGVKGVYREEMYYEQMDASLDLIKAKQVWESLGGSASAGKGVKIAVIDGGIRPENPLFRDDGFAAPATKPSNDYCSVVEPEFCNNKLIAARFSTPTFVTLEGEHMSPLGMGGHGTHTSGTTAGVPTEIWFNGTTDQLPEDGSKDGYTKVTVSGVAPGAYLMHYKALFQVLKADGSVTGSGSNVMLLEALDWAVKDGADVINNSWGGSAGADPSTSPYQAAFKAAENAGVVVVTSAGNSGPAAQSVGCPGCIESGITVASTTTGRFFANTVTPTGGASILAIPGSEYGTTIANLTEDLKGTVADAAVLAPANPLACSAFPADTFKDKIALISRGTCSFSIKINNAMAAGAKGVIVVQNSGAMPSTMSNPGTTIPSLMISKADGATLAALVASKPATEVSLSRFASRVMNSQYADNMSDFSSRGPDGDNNILKPDMGAPGGSILSSTSPEDADGATFQLMSGTSMASPHVAGAAAVMKQLHPTWTAVEIKTALTSSSVNGLKKEDASSATTPFDIGAGRLDLARATKAAVTFDKPSFAQNPCVINCNFTRSIRNMSNKEVTWTGTVNFAGSAATGTLDKTSITLKPYGQAGDKADFVLAVDGSQATYGAWAFGNIEWTSSDASVPSATMPIAVRVANTADSTTLATASSTVLKKDAPTQVTVNFGNKAFDKQMTLTAVAPAGTKLVADSQAAIVTNGTQFLLDGNASTGRVSWTGTVAKPALTMSSIAPWGAMTLKGMGSTALTCSGECDDNMLSFNLGAAGIAVTYGGATYTRLHVSTNGFVQLSNSATAPSASAANVKLPSTTAPANLLAPFWTDLDLAGGSSGAGQLYLDVLTNDAGEDYLIVEWNGVEEWDVPGKTYTFQIGMRVNGPENVEFSYQDLNSTLPASMTVGLQESSRSLGTSLYYANGTSATGTAPTANSAFGHSYQGPGTVAMNYNLELTGPIDLGVADSITTDEDTASAATDVLANEKTSTNKIIYVEASSNGQTLKAINKAAVQPNGALTNVAIATAPAHGAASVVEGKVVYAPAANYNGKDSFTYTAEDATGMKTAATTVNVTVNATNDAPTVTGSTVSVNEGDSATLTATGTDIDGDALTYTWTQLTGPSMTINGSGNKVTVAAAEVSAATTATFSVTVNDGKVTSAPATVTLNIADVPKPEVVKKSGGAGGLLGLLLLPVVFLRRKYKM
jgi:subtilisin family serine protease